MKLTLARMAEVLDLRTGELPSPGSQSWERVPSSVVIDSREARAGSLFVCIKGVKSDGHDFALKAVEAGACAVLAERNPFARAVMAPVPVLLCRNTVEALGKIAHRHRQDMRGKVIGITGTAGKTTVKEVLAQVLSRTGECAKSPANKNNQIGLPLSMLAASEQAKFWVMEAGISLPHDMDELGGILEPDYAIIINIGSGHLEGLGGMGVAYHKARLLHYLSAFGEGLVSADYPDLRREALGSGKPLIFFSVGNDQVECRASYAGPSEKCEAPDSNGTRIMRGRYKVRVFNNFFEVEAPFRGCFGAENVAAIAGAAIRLGMSVKDIQAGFAEAVLPLSRFACKELGSKLIIDDSYNANPLSMNRMLSVVAEMAEETGSKIFLVFGEMRELGSEAPGAHASLGVEIASIGPTVVFWKGGHGNAVLNALRSSGWNGPFIEIEGPEDFLAALPVLGVTPCGRPGEQNGSEHAVFLIKGSRGNKLEEISGALLNYLQ